MPSKTGPRSSACHVVEASCVNIKGIPIRHSPGPCLCHVLQRRRPTCCSEPRRAPRGTEVWLLDERGTCTCTLLLLLDVVAHVSCLCTCSVDTARQCAHETT
ncbi:hypothetical protein M441DRAFT_330611 [Trichoderma asperellum CBS 433.97]|uniref:Uncharacterized protein n=1 Tax=Trichoderma asperellum (strain ATCC 204424 / CBS 433.97 / NBRC 101777) TaxID=1042311 RepID=A0A2T3YS89_TRIA4|nr:hypothetical protein M441DRAFT_330611 [Trichoderma asperellum CBS 433.97]PTB35397.1 hypothetical protein M441DRAFT_330611 [Trichoderma asperellum CBS 433.97]